jgi:hypothetical protein
VFLEQEDSALEEVPLSFDFWRYTIDTKVVEFTEMVATPYIAFVKRVDYEFQGDSLHRDVTVECPDAGSFSLREGTYLVVVTWSVAVPVVIKDFSIRRGYRSVLNLSPDDFVWIVY